MLEKLSTPLEYPEEAAQEILALLAQSGAFNPNSGHLTSTGIGEHAADAMIAIHKKLTTYYKTLEQ